MSTVIMSRFELRIRSSDHNNYYVYYNLVIGIRFYTNVT